MTPTETKVEVSVPNIHSILYSIDKNNPLGSAPENPYDDSQFNSWEYSIQRWLAFNPQTTIIKPTTYDDVHTEVNKPLITIVSPLQSFEYSKDSRLSVIFSIKAKYPISRADFYLNDEFIGTSDTNPFIFNFIPSSTESFIVGTNKLKVVVYDNVYNKNETTVLVKIKN